MKKIQKCWFNEYLWAVSESIMKESASQNNHEQTASKRFYYVVFLVEKVQKYAKTTFLINHSKIKFSHKRCNIAPPFLLSFFAL